MTAQPAHEWRASTELLADPLAGSRPLEPTADIVALRDDQPPTAQHLVLRVVGRVAARPAH